MILEKTLELYGMPSNWDRVAEFYLEVIEDLPMDIIIDAMRTLRQTCKWFPKPSEIRDAINSIHWQRVMAASKLRLMRHAVVA